MRRARLTTHPVPDWYSVYQATTSGTKWGIDCDLQIGHGHELLGDRLTFRHDYFFVATAFDAAGNENVC